MASLAAGTSYDCILYFIKYLNLNFLSILILNFQFPQKFEFNEEFLIFVAKCHNSGCFVDFSSNSISQRNARIRHFGNQQQSVPGVPVAKSPRSGELDKVASIWTCVKESYHLFENCLYEDRVSVPSTELKVPVTTISSSPRWNGGSPVRGTLPSSSSSNSMLFSRVDSFTSDGSTSVPHCQIASSKDAASIVHLSPKTPPRPTDPTASNSALICPTSPQLSSIADPIDATCRKMDHILPICSVYSLAVWDTIHWQGFSALLPKPVRRLIGVGSAQVASKLRCVIDEQQAEIASLKQSLAAAEARARDAEQLLNYSHAHQFASSVTVAADTCFSDDQIEFVTRMESPFIMHDSFR